MVGNGVGGSAGQAQGGAANSQGDAGGQRDEGAAAVRELRLALVCYGGVSLAIYMHGITKEIQKLVVASIALERGVTLPESSSEEAYRGLLARMRDGRDGEDAKAANGVATRVVVDIISGTSAGGINGICLAKSLACNRSQDALRDVWLDKGDIGKLLRAPSRLPHWIPKLVWAAGGALIDRRLSPLKGDDMTGWLHGAFADMDASPPAIDGVGSLLPRAHPLRLYVPITDFRGYNRRIPLADPRFVLDRTHRHVLEFTFTEGAENQFSGDYNHALAFAARATSSFPGAFPPVTIGDYERSVPGGNKLGGLLTRLFPFYPLSHADPVETQFIDGGVLDNRPFRTTIDAIRLQPAASEVVRRLLYIEPSPLPDDGEQPVGQPPTWIAAAWAGYASIPRQEPILDDLMTLAERNEAVLRIQEIIRASFGTVRERVRELVAGPLKWDNIDQPPVVDGYEEVVRWRELVEHEALERAGFNAATYLRLRLAQVLTGFAHAIADVLDYPVDSYHAGFIRTALRHAVADELLVDEPTPDQQAAQRGFLSGFDLAYHERRLRFLTAAFSWWYRNCGEPGYPTRAELDRAKGLLSDRLEAVNAIIPAMARDEAVHDLVKGVFSQTDIDDVVLERSYDVERFLAVQRERLAELRGRIGAGIERRLAATEQALFDNLREVSEPWAAPVKTDLMVRYLGFPFWDVLIFPVQALSGVDERDFVEVARISPLDTQVLAAPHARRLAGQRLGNFGAFFDRPGREQDYLLGRLHAAERLVAILLDDPERPGLDPPDPGACKPIFNAILAEERGALDRAGTLIEALQRDVNSVDVPSTSTPA